MTKGLLRVFTAGSVDDGKSTLIGRLLYDTKSIYEDQYEAIKTSSELRGEEQVNLALLTDGLRAEREQGITIDVAYRYFSTPKRKFIVADTPGHIQYTRNMVTGSSTADLAIIMVDARNGISEQTRRHTLITSLIGIKHIVVCVNKMDIVGFKEEIFEKIRRDFEFFSSTLELADVQFVPISALSGENVVDKSKKMLWYIGHPLLKILEDIEIDENDNSSEFRFPIQYVIRPQSIAYHDYRGYAGKVTGGKIKKGNEVVVLPSGLTSKVRSIETYDGEIEEAYPGMSVNILLEDDIDISRGDLLVSKHNNPVIEQNINLIICWMNEKKLVVGGKYAIKHNTKDTHGIIKDIQYKVDINTLQHLKDDMEIRLNDIGKISLRTTNPLFFDSYNKNHNIGSLILIDEATNETVGAGIIV